MKGVASKSEDPIGLLDSGVGGFSLLGHIQARLPSERLLYFADQAHVPYGPRPVEAIRDYCEGISRFLLGQGAKLIVVACNTASAAALEHLRLSFPDVPFVGMEPAVKPGATHSQRGKIGILATPGTFGSRRYAALMARYAQGVVTFEDPCTGLVEQIEAGRIEAPETEAILRKALTPMLAAGADTLVLGCTHYPFALPLIRRMVGPAVTVIDPAPAVARQVERLLLEAGLASSETPTSPNRAFTTGDGDRLAIVTGRLLGQSLTITQVAWHGRDVHFLPQHRSR